MGARHDHLWPQLPAPSKLLPRAALPHFTALQAKDPGVGARVLPGTWGSAVAGHTLGWRHLLVVGDLIRFWSWFGVGLVLD